jgi:hypothetical protein
MATFPSKVNYATGDILTATNMNDVGGAINLLDGSQGAAGKNGIINGAMDIWQRGTSFIGTGYNYTADRFLCFRGSFAAGMTITRQTSAQVGFQYALRTQRDSGNTGTQGLTTNYALETANSLQYAGKTITISFYARAGANYSGGAYTVTAYSGTGTDQATSSIGSWTGSATLGSGTATLTTTFQRFTFSVAVGSTATQLGLNMGWTPTGTAGANDWVEVTGVQLEAANTASNFQRTSGSIGGELAACQRYYWRSTGVEAYGRVAGLGIAASTTSVLFTPVLPVSMRIYPASVDYSTLCIYDAVTITAISSLTLQSGAGSLNTTSINAAVTGATAFRPYFLAANNSTSAYIGFSAEL